MKKIFYLFIVILGCTNFYCQTKDIKVNLVIVMDDELRDINMYNNYITVIDSLNNEYKIDFDYTIGDLKVTQSCYEKLFNKGNKKVYISFVDREIKPTIYEKEYKCELPIEMINDTYMLLKIYNSSKKENKKYYFGDKDYITQILSPGLGTILKYKN
jgi:hypothetical protein